MVPYRLRTRSDAVFGGVVFVLLTALGVAMLAWPNRAVPDDPAAYAPVRGTMQDAVDCGVRRLACVRFHLVGDPRLYETRVLHGGHAATQPPFGRVRLAFHVLRADHGGPSPQAGPGATHPTFGLTVDGVELRSLKDELAWAASPGQAWLGAMPLGLGLAGLVVMALAWRRLPPTESPAARPARPAPPPTRDPRRKAARDRR